MPPSTSTNAVQFNVMFSSLNNNVLIPTFTLRNARCRGLRCMYDPAAQTSFVSERAVSALKPRVIDPNLQIQISGFNATSLKQTKLVEVDVDVGENTWKIPAVVVPEIKTTINANLSQIVKSFKECGIELADKFLDCGDGTIDVLLGVDSSHVLPVHSCRFGNSEGLSTVYHTATGVMLAGSVENLSCNLPHLHLVKSFIKDFDDHFK